MLWFTGLEVLYWTFRVQKPDASSAVCHNYIMIKKGHLRLHIVCSVVCTIVHIHQRVVTYVKLQDVPGLGDLRIFAVVRNRLVHLGLKHEVDVVLQIIARERHQRFQNYYHEKKQGELK